MVDKKKDDSNNDKPMHTMEIVPKKSAAPMIVGGVVLVAAVGVLALQLSSVRGERDNAAKAVEKTKDELASAQKTLTERAESAEAERDECKKNATELSEQITGLESALKSTESEIGNLKDENAQAARELAQFKAFSSKFKRMVDAGKLEVVFRRGRMVVNLPAQVLFDSGSADLSEDGKKALDEVAHILRTVRDKRFVVGGHTDDQKIKKAKFESNWELSTARALAVTELLIKGGVKPSSLTAAGFAEFSPLTSNKTEEGRQKNRRIEIILEPHLKDIEPPAPKKAKSGKK